MNLFALQSYVIKLRNHYANDVAVLIIDRTTTVPRLDFGVYLGQPCIISKSTTRANYTFGNLDGVTELFSVRVARNQHTFTKFHAC